MKGSSKVNKIGTRVNVNTKSETEKRVTRAALRRCTNGVVSGNPKGFCGTRISDDGKSKGNVNLSAQCTYKCEKMVTRSASGGIKDEQSARIGTVDGNPSARRCRKAKGDVNLSAPCVYKIEKRVTRSASRGREYEASARIGNVEGNHSFRQGDAYLSTPCVYKIEKRVTRSASRGREDEGSARIGNVKGNEFIQNGKDKVGAKFSGGPIDESSADLIGEEDGFEAEKRRVPAKRKKVQVEEKHGMFHGWTSEQELALETAYFAAKATPNFWKKVAKMVPGKSAQECFDKIHSELLTPAQRQPRSRAKATDSCLSLSASKLLNASEPDTKRLKNSKQQSRLTHKTVRQLLHRQYAADQHYEADLFSVLEPTLDPSTQCVPVNGPVTSPELNREGPGLEKKFQKISSSAHRKLPQQSNDSRGATVTSPAVLKKIKSKALHEKYIDQLHSRESRRKTMALRERKCTQHKSGGSKEDNLWNSVAIKDAKSALAFCARDAIKQFQYLQNSNTNKFDDDVDDFLDSSEDDFED